MQLRTLAALLMMRPRLQYDPAMNRGLRIGTLCAGAALALLVGGGAASAQTTPVQPRTTVPTTSPQAGTFPVLQVADLPAGYRMGSGSPFQASPQSPRYPTIDKCLWDFDNPFSGLTPDIYQSSFQQTMPVSGISLAFVFDAAKPATAFYDNYETAYRAAQKCTMTKAPSSSSSTPTNYGKITPLKVGNLGDASFGVVITPPSTTFPPVKQVFIRDGSSVVSLRVTDPDMSVKEFAALAKVAAKRAS